ncbi:hypothetical protein BKA66DRAFT_567533 [Pyrenochaeta sp. MPI-SDFR-AT-0127]|nr:hypothetical protein BKA66DRAFT_567533 [Pyrenochaeta sp. MPI-SDFR-AT-0127]
MDWNDFQQRARAVLPQQELKPRRCWIGVLSHEKGPEEPLQELDFIWMIGHSKISIQKIYETYQKRHDMDDFHLKFKDALIDRDDLLRSFQEPGNDLVLFQACLFNEPEVILRASDRQSLSGVPDSQAGSQADPQANSPGASQNSAQSCLVTRTKDATLGNDVALEANESSVKAQNANSPVTLTLAAQERIVPPWDSLRDVERPFVESVVEQQHEPFSPPPSARILHQFPLNHGSHELDNNNNMPQNIPFFAGRIDTARQPDSAPYMLPYGEATTHGEVLAVGSYGPGVKAEKRSSLSPQNPPLFPTFVKEQPQPFNPDSVFHRAPSPEMSQEDPLLTDQNIRAIIEKQNPEILEAGVARSMRVLEGLKVTFSRYALSNADAQSWKQAIEKLLPQAERKRTVVGVVGNTGAGKSSVINAMLDEERLVPTNCMRACTAVVTEMSWNHSTDPSAKYRAEIEFISREDWEKELNVLLKEFLTEHGSLSREASDPNSDAGIAWAKFHSVYPKIPRDCLERCTVPDLMSESAVVNVLGTVKKICAAMPERFYHELQRYVDSKEKVTIKGKEKDKNKSKDKEKKNPFELEYWPLIKVVKIYTKSSALSTGAVIVDLPGVHDSNAARSAVAQGYMKQCTGLWIVAPINRAVDDKAAKTLLGDSFKRQLKYDGGFSSVTFICSKTDDISITEAIESLELEDEVTEFEEQEYQYKQQTEGIQGQISDLKESQEVYKIALADANNDIEVWEGFQEDLEAGRRVFAPISKSSKRKMGSPKTKSRKKRPSYVDISDDEFLVSDDEDSELDDPCEDLAIHTPRTRLTADDVRIKLKELRETKKMARREVMQIRRSIEELKPQISGIQARIDDIKGKVSHICIAGRNEYSKSAIQQDFAAGIKEIDQENAAEEDEDNFNPDEELRDYDQVARSLPVFCVSSRAYQKMCGRLQKDDGVPGFTTREETELPQLQAHCKKLTEGGRIQTCRTFLLSFCQLLTTFNLWASNDGTGVRMSDDDKRRQVSHLKRRLKELETGLEEAVLACINEMRAELKNHILDKCPELINDAIEAAPTTANAWGQKDMGGLVWATYKAVVRRDGVYYSSSAGHRDFNADLVDPILKKLASGWERAFQMRLPKAFGTYIGNSNKILHRFHEAIEERAHENGVSLANLSILKTQVHTYEQLFKDLGIVLLTQMTELQREANRDFTPTIANIMHTVYDLCTVEHGQGSYKRMKEHMKNHVERERHKMFHAATRTVELHLDQMCKALQNSMETKADEIFLKMNTDYMHVLGGMARPQPAMLQSSEERNLRAEIRDVLRGIDTQFEPIANGEIQEPALVEDDDSGVFESAQESAQESVNADVDDDSVMNGVDDTTITEPTPPRPAAPQHDRNGAYESERHSRRSTLSNDTMNEEL